MEDPTLSKTCQICQSNAPPKVKFYQHYGAICCYSCKAFFRRYVRGENNIHLHRCKENNSCPLTEGRKTCKNCRYNKCLQVGMTPEKVLNEEDRKKYTHPKKNKRKRDETTEDTSLGNVQFSLLFIFDKIFSWKISKLQNLNFSYFDITDFRYY